EQRQHEPWRRRYPLQSRRQPGGLGGDDERVHRLVPAREDTRGGGKLTQGGAAPAPAFLRDRPPPPLSCHAHHPPAPPGHRARPQPAHAAGPEHTGAHRAGSISTPGFMMPSGSTAALAPRKAAANGAGRCCSYHLRCSRPTAWWWVMVPPSPITTSDTACLIACHCSTSSPRRAGASTV